MTFDLNIGLTVHCGKEPEDIAKTNLRNHCEKRKYFHKATKWFGMYINPNDLSLRFCLSFDFPWHQSNDMDNIIRDMRDISEIVKDNNRVGSVQKHKIGRNDPCPCGSKLNSKNAVY